MTQIMRELEKNINRNERSVRFLQVLRFPLVMRFERQRWYDDV